ncbi:TonB-dependent receptor plug domain-containing protein [Novosphingobium huizhouense]|uniref:TonB-dependent receptor plug domain-containing protein n=1 Tax=Novosphingobium huizhouense TaxID=2866625 RepID=UPI001CD8A00E|nr:TonB-dependent receptor [Novosphingobium huizhouense]
MKKFGSIWLAGVALAAVATGGAAPALAQGAPEGASADEGAAIIVTGSRIRRDPLDQAAPVVTLDSEAIAKTGLSSVADVLQRLPSSAGGLNTKFNNSGNLGNPPDGGGVGAGSATIDLRYLGGKRTLVLVDGMRYVNGASASGIPASVDLNSIPEGMIERIEVLQSAASPLYGSDAIAGVVNIITKTNQKGFKGSAQYGQYLGKGDGETQNYQLSWGTGKDGVSLVVGGSYVKQMDVKARDRSISQFPNPGQTSCSDPIGGCSSATPLGRFIVFGQNMTLRSPVLTGKPVYDPTLATGDFKPFTSADRFNFAPFNYFQTPSERYGGFVNVRAEFSDAIAFKGMAVYNHRHSQNQAAFLPLFIGPDAGNGNLLDTIKIDATNPYNPFGVTLDSSNYSFIARRLVEAGQRTYTQDVDTFDVKAGFEGKFSMFGKNWFWDVTGVYGTNEARQLFTGNVNAAKLAQALGPVANCTGDCVPFNIFGGVGSVTQAMLDYVGFDERAKSGQALYDFQANLSGELFDLPGGPVGIAIGAEHRKQEGYFEPDPVIQAGLGADIPAQAARGSFKVDEIYGEIRLPLLKDTPFFHSLELNGAARYSDYSTFGGNTTLTGGVQWKPVADLMFRGSYGESLRAPSIGELYGARSRFDQPLSDPCTNVPGSLWNTSATAKANCIANGVPANGSYQEPQGGQLPVLTGGNPDLQPETARTILIGGVYSPDWAQRKISLEVNYYDIKLEGAIASIGADVLLNRCALAGDALSCNAVKRTPSGFISSINGVLLNTGTIRTKGLDATLNLHTGDTGAGAFNLSVYANFLFKYEEGVPATTGVTTTSYLGYERGSPDQAYPRFKSTSVLDWTIGPVTTTLTGRYISGVKEIQDTTKKLGSRFYTDAQIQYRPSFADSRFVFTLGVNNLFDVDPPACYSCSLNNYDPTTYDVPGQFGYLRLSYAM